MARLAPLITVACSRILARSMPMPRRWLAGSSAKVTTCTAKRSLCWVKTPPPCFFTQHNDLFAVQVVTFADEPASQRRGIGIDLAKIRLHATVINGANLAILGAHGMRLFPPVDKNGEVLHRRT